MHSLPWELIELVHARLDGLAVVNLVEAIKDSPQWHMVHTYCTSQPVHLRCLPYWAPDTVTFDRLELVLRQFRKVTLEVVLRQCAYGSDCLYGHNYGFESDRLNEVVQRCRTSVHAVELDYIYNFTALVDPVLVTKARFYEAPLDQLAAMTSLVSLELVGYSHQFFNLEHLSHLRHVVVRSPLVDYYQLACTLVLPDQLALLRLVNAKATIWTERLEELHTLDVDNLEVRWQPKQLAALREVRWHSTVRLECINAVVREAPQLARLELSGTDHRLEAVPQQATALKLHDITRRGLIGLDFPLEIEEIAIEVPRDLAVDFAAFERLRKVAVVGGRVANYPERAEHLTLDTMNPLGSLSSFTALQLLHLVGPALTGPLDLSQCLASTITVDNTNLSHLSGFPMSLELLTLTGNPELARICPLIGPKLRSLEVKNNPRLDEVDALGPNLASASVYGPQRLCVLDSVTALSVDWTQTTNCNLPESLHRLKITLTAILRFSRLPPVASLHIEVVDDVWTMPPIPQSVKLVFIGTPENCGELGRLPTPLNQLIAHLDRLETLEIAGVCLESLGPLSLPRTVQSASFVRCQALQMWLEHGGLQRLLMVGTQQATGEPTQWWFELVGPVEIIETAGLPSEFGGVRDPWLDHELYRQVMAQAPPQLRGLRQEEFWHDPDHRGTVQAVGEWSKARGAHATCLLWSHDLNRESHRAVSKH